MYSFVSPTLPSIDEDNGHNSDPDDDEDDASIQHSKASKLNTSIGSEGNTRRGTRKRTPPTLFSFPTATTTTSHSGSSSSSGAAPTTLSSHRAAGGTGAGDGVGELRYLFCLQIEDSTGSADVMVYDKVRAYVCA